MIAARHAGMVLIIFALAGYAQDFDAVLRDKPPLEAIPMLRQAKGPQATLALGVAYYMARQYRLFEMTMREAIAAEPQNPAPYYYLGRYQDANLSDFAAAERSFREVLKRNPKHAKAHYYLGHALEAQGHNAEAEAEFRETLKLDASLAMARDGLARLRLAAGDAQAALAENPSGAKLRGQILIRLNRWAGAAAELKRAADADTTDASLWYLLSRCHTQLDRPEDAALALERYRLLSKTY
ncbi:MAG: tetratricopeptide repeat protein [Bryobacterales bacterium]|nr:tetratricopeptide repeat protein [Bryobacterales bacterium]